MTTCIQSVTIEQPNSPYIFYGMEMAPICPPSYKPEENNDFIVMKTLDNSIITWWNNKSIVKVSPDGTTKFWNPKPDLKSAVTLYSNQSSFFQFNKDSSVVYSTKRYNLYWSPPVEGTPEVGTQIFGYDYINGSDEDMSDVDSTG
jgi:hypothetical protein